MKASDLQSIPDSAWTLVSVDNNTRVYRCVLDDKGTFAYKKEHLGTDTHAEQNKQEYDDSFGRRFGKAAKVASVPLDVYFNPLNQIVEKQQQGDYEHYKWWLNRPENQRYRTFRGKI